MPFKRVISLADEFQYEMKHWDIGKTNTGRFEEGMGGKPEAMRIAVVTLDPDGIILAGNPAVVECTGRSREALLGRSLQEIIDPADWGLVEDALERARAGTVHIRARGSETRVLALTLTPRLSAHGPFGGYYGLLCGTTGQSPREETLALAVDAAPCGILIVTREGHIVLANQAVERIFGYPRHELLGHGVEILLPEPLLSRHQEIRFTASAERLRSAMRSRTVSGRHKLGYEVPVQVDLNEVAVAGDPLVLVSIFDATERVRHETQLREAKRGAEAASRAKSDFLARMSHEIRTPMNLIMGMNAILLDSELTERQRHCVEIAHRNVKRLLRLINGILDLSKVEAGKLILEVAPFDLHQLLRDVLETFAAAFDEKGLEARLTVDPALRSGWEGDAGRLQQILMNLVGNAVKFTDQGRVEVKAAPARRRSGPDGIRIEVADTGPGIRPGDRELLFESFQQGDVGYSRRHEGTGLGLTIAQTLVRMMGGEIWIEDGDRGVGTKFIFTAFPRECRQVPELNTGAIPAVEPAASIRSGMRILLVEDNHENSFLVQAYLERLPLELDFAFNGVEAIAKRQAAEYDLILMDIQMPVMDGYQATREIRAWESAGGRSPVPIVALTAHALTGAAEEARDAGCDGHLSKPVERAELIEVILRLGREPQEAAPAQPGLDLIIARRRPAFLARRHRDLEVIREALEQSDYSAIQRIGHDCKGIGRGFGFPAVSEAGAQLEAAARALDRAAVEAATQRLAAAIDA